MTTLEASIRKALEDTGVQEVTLTFYKDGDGVDVLPNVTLGVRLADGEKAHRVVRVPTPCLPGARSVVDGIPDAVRSEFMKDWVSCR